MRTTNVLKFAQVIALSAMIAFQAFASVPKAHGPTVPPDPWNVSAINHKIATTNVKPGAPLVITKDMQAIMDHLTLTQYSRAAKEINTVTLTAHGFTVPPCDYKDCSATCPCSWYDVSCIWNNFWVC